MDSVKLWLFEAAAKRYGSYFEKTALKYFEYFFYIFLSNSGLEAAKLPEYFYCNKLDKGVQHAGVGGWVGTNTFHLAKHWSFLIIFLYSM